MAKSINKIQLMGHLGADPEVRTFQDGRKVCNVRVATTDTWTDKDTGEKREQTEWHSVAIFNQGLIGVAEAFLKKGSKAMFEGSLRTRKWQDQGGNDRYATEVVLQGPKADLFLLDGAPEGDDQNG